MMPPCRRARIAYKDDAVGELVGTEMEVKHAAVGVDDEFGWRYDHGAVGCYGI